MFGVEGGKSALLAALLSSPLWLLRSPQPLLLLLLVVLLVNFVARVTHSGFSMSGRFRAASLGLIFAIYPWLRVPENELQKAQIEQQSLSVGKVTSEM